MPLREDGRIKAAVPVCLERLRRLVRCADPSRRQQPSIDACMVWINRLSSPIGECTYKGKFARCKAVSNVFASRELAYSQVAESSQQHQPADGGSVPQTGLAAASKQPDAARTYTKAELTDIAEVSFKYREQHHKRVHSMSCYAL